MAEWPGLDELKQRLDIVDDDWDGDGEYEEETRLSRLLTTAIAWTKAKVGDWDEDEDEPTAAMAQAALERACELATEPQAPDTVERRSTKLLFGQRRKFGISG